MPSLREALQLIGLTTDTAVPTGLTGIRPQSLREVIAACQDPQVAQWTNPSRGRAENKSFSEEAQGIGTDGVHWFFSNNANDGREGLWKLDWDFKVIAKLPSPFDPDGTHVGALSVRDGYVYVALQGPHGVWKVSTDFEQSIFLKAAALPDSDMFAWCDRNPHNGYIYTSAFHVPSHLRAYAESPQGTLTRSPEHDIPLIQPAEYRPTTRVQGGCFTPHHKWLAVCDDAGYPNPFDPATWWVERIHCHSTLNGAFLGRHLLPASTDESGSVLPTSTRNELEDVWVYPLTATGGQPIHVHVLELNNEELSTDDFYLWHFTVPDPAAL